MNGKTQDAINSLEDHLATYSIHQDTQDCVALRLLEKCNKDLKSKLK